MTKKAARARIIAEKIAADAADKAKRREETFSHPVAIAVEPLRAAAVKQAEVDATAYVARVEAALAKHGFDLNAIAPEPGRNVSREEYRRASSKRAAFLSLARPVDKRRANPSPLIVAMDSDLIARYIINTKEEAEFQYEQYVYKLVSKLKEKSPAAVTTATLNNESLEDGYLWYLSLLTVTRADGAVEKWRTRMIFNTSIYGKVFPQWPTRIVK